MATAPAPAACTAVAPPPADLAAWRTTDAAALTIGQPTTLTLTPAAATAFAITPDRAPAPGSFGGVVPLTVTTYGTYRVALSAGAWIDLIDPAKTSLKSVAHTEGPACSGIRKIVDFTLAPGRYTLQLSSAKAASIRVLVAPR
ncbi:hypothetical protein [Sphingomonas sp.]|uniref:hypothetical protein n=1 Tax=Sphingomonas sp. TaxID=28214 RepID=UPI0025F1FEED|nr:hypothetical protein [Sphingomonas sp.]